MKTKIKPPAVCKKCDGRGYIFDEKGNSVICECKEQIEYEMRLSAARIPNRFHNKTFDTFKGREKTIRDVRKAAETYVKGFNPRENKEMKGLLFIGAVGSGKTHIAVAMLKEIIKKGYSGLYYDVPELLQKLRESYDSRSDEMESDIFFEAASADVMLLDDLGSESTTGWVRDRLSLIIDRRYKDNKPILITTSIEIEELEPKVGKRIVSRLCEMCERFVDFPQQDYRKRNFK